MATNAQLNANRANAQASTGPRTPEGKARASRNALRHGLASADLIVDSGDESLFADTKSQLMAELRPSGALQMAMFNQLLRAHWNMERAARLMNENEANPRECDRFLRYYRTWEASFHRNLRELRRLQATPRNEPKPAPEVKQNEPKQNEPKPAPADLSRFFCFDQKRIGNPALRSYYPIPKAA